MLLPLSAGILVADRLQAKPWVFVLVTLSGLALWRLRRDTWLAPLGGLLLGMGLGALVLAVRLHAPVPEASAGPVPLTLLKPPLRRGPACRVEVHVHGAQGGRALLRTPEEACSCLPGQRALGRIRCAVPLSAWTAAVDRRLLRAVHGGLFRRAHPVVPEPEEARGSTVAGE